MLASRFATLRERGRRALVCYVTAGHPDPASSIALLRGLESAGTDVIELGAYARFLTPELELLWRAVFRNVWAQWRWEHKLRDYAPGFAESPVATKFAPLRPRADATATDDDHPHGVWASSFVSARRHHTGAVELRMT